VPTHARVYVRIMYNVRHVILCASVRSREHRGMHVGEECFRVRYYYYIIIYCFTMRFYSYLIFYYDVYVCFILGTAFEIRYRWLFVICSCTACVVYTTRPGRDVNICLLFYRSNKQTTLYILLYFMYIVHMCYAY